VNVIIVSIHWFCRNARLEENAFVTTVRLMLTLGEGTVFGSRFCLWVNCFSSLLYLLSLNSKGI